MTGGIGTLAGREPAALPAGDILEALVSAEEGLDEAEARRRLEESGPNILEKGSGGGVLKLLWRQVNDPPINQIGGYVDNGHERLNLIEGDSLLESEQECLFATNYVEEKDWYQIVLAGVANTKVEDEAQRQELKQRFEEAKANQVKVNVPSGPPSLEEAEKRSY